VLFRAGLWINVKHIEKLPDPLFASSRIATIFLQMLLQGWTGGAAGVAAQMPDSLEIGSTPPATKPRPKGQQPETEIQKSEVKGLFEKKLTKEEKKKIAEERRKARKAAKEAKKAAQE